MKLDQSRAASDLTANGYTTLRLLDAATCRSLAALYDDETRFRSRVVMQRHNFGRGEYKYLAYPLPDPVAALRTALYPPLAAIANEWRETLREDGRLPADARRVPRRVPRSGPDATDAAAAALWAG